MKVKTSELTGHTLSWAVNECEYRKIQADGCAVKSWVLDDHESGCVRALSDLTALEIIQREHISIICAEGDYNPSKAGTPDCYDTYWVADIGRQFPDYIHGPQGDNWGNHFQISVNCITGNTLIEAAMRCYVLETLGPEIDIPDTITPV